MPGDSRGSTSGQNPSEGTTTEEDKKARRHGLGAAIAPIAIFIIVLAVWLSVPLGRRRAVKHIAVPRTAQPRSQTREFDFQLEEFLREITIESVADPQSAGVRLELLDDSGARLWCSPLVKGRRVLTFSVGNGFAPGRYTLRFIEHDVSGGYSVDVSRPHPMTGSQKLWLFVGVASVVTGGLYARARGRGHRGHPQPNLRVTGLVFGCVSFWLAGMTIATLAHEGGHAIAASAFGVLDLSRTDLLGLKGAPHVGHAFGGPVAPWQRAILSIAGPAFPTIIAYLSFTLWRSKSGKRIRSNAVVLDVFWSGLTALLLFGHLGLLLPMAGLMSDTDYSGFVENTGWSYSLSNALIGAVCIINTLLIFLLARHLIGLLRRLRGSLTEAPK